MAENKKKFKHSDYTGLLVQGNLRGAVDYLREFPQKKRLVAKYDKVFGEGRFPKSSGNENVQKIIDVFQSYYRRIFWGGCDKTSAAKRLIEELETFFDLHLDTNSEESIEKSMDILDENIKEYLRYESFEYLGGITQGYFGPYIWKRTEKKTYNVKIPSGISEYSVYMMHGFVSRSWLDCISFKRMGTGGWADDDGTLYCVHKTYSKFMLTSIFKVHFLKHEAQHAWDKANFTDITGVELEYRAKLVQLIYGSGSRTFLSFLTSADDSDPDNSHSMASYRLISDLSQKIFSNDFEKDASKWKKKVKQIKTASLELFNADTERLKSDENKKSKKFFTEPSQTESTQTEIEDTVTQDDTN